MYESGKSEKTVSPDIELLRSHDPQAIERWFLEYVDKLYTYVFYRVSGNAELADDIVQETFLLALQKIKNFNPQRGTMLVWLTYLSKNCIKKNLRENNKYKSYSEFWNKIDKGLLTAYKQLATAPLPPEILEHAETVKLVHMTMSSIPGNYQQALTLHYFKGHSLREISRLRQISEGAARILLYRARKAFEITFINLASAGQENTFL